MALSILAVFLLWTLAVTFIDVAPIGPRGSKVGFATVNQFVHRLTGVNMPLYTVTDWLGLVPMGIVFSFASLGLIQWIQRKSLLKVDRSLLILGGFYLATFGVYVFFEIFAINYRPIHINGILEASYPSSTTMLATCVMPTAAMQLRSRIHSPAIKGCVTWAIVAFMAFMVVGRLLSGVHWFTDIVGGALCSAGLILLYRALVE